MPNPVMRRRVEGMAPGGSHATLAANFVSASNQALTKTSNASLQLNATDWTVVGWTRPTLVTGFRKLVGKTNGTFDWGLQINPTGFGGGPCIEAYTSGGSVQFQGNVVANTWYWFWAQFSGGFLAVSVNNGSAAQAARAAPNASAANFGIGNTGDAGGGPFDGQIRAVGVWKRLLTGGELATIFAAGRQAQLAAVTTGMQASLVSIWDMSQSGNPGLDSFGTNGLTNVNGVTQVVVT